MSKDFSHLHLHTTYSILDGYGTPEQVVNRMKKLGMKSFAITDHGNVGGVLPFYLKCKEEGVKLIIGCEFYIVADIKENKAESKGYENNNNDANNVYLRRSSFWNMAKEF